MILQIIISNWILDLVTGILAKISLGTGIWYPPSRPSPNLVGNSCYVPQVGLCEAPGCPAEALNLCAKFSKFLVLSASSLSLSEI